MDQDLRRHTQSALYGLLLIVGLQICWWVTHRHAPSQSRLVLGPPKGVLLTGVAFVFLSAKLAVRAPSKLELWAEPLAMWFGGCVGVTMCLFAVGPGNLWPIALVVLAMTLAVFCGIGGGLAWLAMTFQSRD
ncbi:MAG: hypothetical protein HN742_12765 [Lentisphaerae bacterium]|jgi:hypothetical protein|nr:hypothetical protein [Lentisphaerota bacterium]MBT4821722.1 hypothetical protein [Lentisphaerota bacterium]MBT5607385.1 hypothetical protein [Lentisphaerota bacterium]MBT7057809.1 hypothetical protein [Lentisphaerota bacterium]MBT7842741.1 hypothetical protein [Lentisphaerota bacterium]